ncbi:MAG: NAD(P)-dependent oxidoreductase [Rhodopseudomonas palustris]|uniref:NAD(P)-dependent oxidoreductase n=1 Tax=Rhodopseudomonas palustris TaxID=1076 RepID=A0A933S161_RHOPL|nr:NAD(P)-dependent oxidoreductase [Rhodopseudomonas palustris]
MVAPAETTSVWVTGATSFLGRHVARQFARDGVEVVGFARRPIAEAEFRTHGFAAVEVGEFDEELLRQGFDRHGAPAAVFHAIGSGSVGQAAADPQADIARTVNSLRVLLEFLAGSAPNARLVYPSSAAIYGDAGEQGLAEDAQADPISVYGQTKWLAEELCRAQARHSGLELVIARLFSVYGPLQHKLLLWELAQRLLSGQRRIELGGTGREARDFVFAPDAAAMICRLAMLPDATGTFNIGTGVATSIRDLAGELAVALGVRAEIEFNGLTRPGDPAHQRADPARLLQTTGLAFTPLRRGLSNYAEWLREQHAEQATRAAGART